jgi:hypothetical protein
MTATAPRSIHSHRRLDPELAVGEAVALPAGTTTAVAVVVCGAAVTVVVFGAAVVFGAVVGFGARDGVGVIPDVGRVAVTSDATLLTACLTDPVELHAARAHKARAIQQARTNPAAVFRTARSSFAKR